MVNVVGRGATAGYDARREVVVVEQRDCVNEGQHELMDEGTTIREGSGLLQPAHVGVDPGVLEPIRIGDQPRKVQDALAIDDAGPSAANVDIDEDLQGRPDRCATSRSWSTVGSPSVTTMRPVARAFSAASRSSLDAATPTDANSMTPGMPASVIASASARVATATPMAPAARWRLAISTDLWTLAPGRRA